MVTYRVTAKVSKRLKRTLDPNPPASSGRFGDWYANLLILRRQHVVMLVSEKTLLPLLVSGKDLASFPNRVPNALAEMLRTLRIPEDEIQSELVEMDTWNFAKTASRQILGSMNDFAKLLDAYLDDGAPLQKQAIRLARVPCSPIGMDSPIEATGKVFGVTVPGNVYKFDLGETGVV